MIQIASAVIWDVVDGKMIICNLDSGKRLELNDTANQIWCELQNSRDMSSLVEQIGKIYPQVPAPQLRQDIEEFVASLARDEFLEPV